MCGALMALTLQQHRHGPCINQSCSPRYVRTCPASPTSCGSQQKRKVLMAGEGVLEEPFTSVENGDTVRAGRPTLPTSLPFLLDRLGSSQRGHTLCIFSPDMISDSNLEAPLIRRQCRSGVTPHSDCIDLLWLGSLWGGFL